MLEVEEKTSEYRLCRKKNGEIVLQRLVIVSEEYVNPSNFDAKTRVKWVDLDTEEE